MQYFHFQSIAVNCSPLDINCLQTSNGSKYITFSIPIKSATKFVLKEKEGMNLAEKTEIQKNNNNPNLQTIWIKCIIYFRKKINLESTEIPSRFQKLLKKHIISGCGRFEKTDTKGDFRLLIQEKDIYITDLSSGQSFGDEHFQNDNNIFSDLNDLKEVESPDDFTWNE